MSEIHVEQSDHGKTLKAHPNDVVEIRLDENLTTGYGWETAEIDSSVLEPLDSSYTEHPGSLLGRGGVRTFRFKAGSPGSAQLRLRLRRPWEPVDAAIEHFEITIEVK